MAPPSVAELGGVEVVKVAGLDSALHPWVGDGVLRLDKLQPEANGQQHFRGAGGGHLYLGRRNGRAAWCIDEVCDPREATATAFLPVAAGVSADCLPLGEHSWQCFDGRRHVEGQLTLE